MVSKAVSLVSEEVHSIEQSSRVPDALNSGIPVNSIATAGAMTAEFGGGSGGGHAQSDSEQMQRNEQNIVVELHPILHLSRGSRSQQPQQLGNNTRSDQYN